MIQELFGQTLRREIDELQRQSLALGEDASDLPAEVMLGVRVAESKAIARRLMRTQGERVLLGVVRQHRAPDQCAGVRFLRNNGAQPAAGN